MLLVTHQIDPSMKYATGLTPLNNPVKQAEKKSTMSSSSPGMAALFEEFIRCCLRKKYSIRTREVYWGWIRRFILFHQKRSPSEMGKREALQFLSHLEEYAQVTASTRSQALSALQFLYRELLQQHFDWADIVGRVKLPAKSACALTRDEMNRVLAGLSGSYWLMASLLYGTGMQLQESVRLRVMDVSIRRNEIVVRDGKGELVRRLKIPQELHQALEAHMEKVLADHREDMKSNWQGVYMPEILQSEYPDANKLLAWQYVFAADRLSRDPCDDKIRRYHLDAREFQRALENAALGAGIDKNISSHRLRTDGMACPLFRAT